MNEILDMSGYGIYVWPAYAIAIGALAITAWGAWRQLRLAREEARRRLAMQENNP